MSPLLSISYLDILSGTAQAESEDFLTPTIQEPQFLQHHSRSSTPLHIRINAELPAPPSPSPSETLLDSSPSEPSLEPSLHIPEEHLSPTHLSIYHFGSRFLPHSSVPIRCILPLHRDRLLLIGTDTGLSVLNMFPEKWADETSGGTGLIQKGPADAQARVIWTGEAYVDHFVVLAHLVTSGVVRLLQCLPDVDLRV